MNASDRTTQRVRQWLRQSSPTPPDAERSVEEVMTTLFRETQLRPRLSFRWFGARGEGGSSMFSALKLGVATALVALFSGLLAVGISQPEDSQAPGAAASAQPSADVEASAGPAAAVTGVIYPRAETRLADEVIQAAVPEVLLTDYVWEFRSVTSDPRLNGTFVFTQNIYQFLADDQRSGTVHSGVGRITNEDGSWVVDIHGFSQPGKIARHNANFALHFTGEGGYDGLSAMLLMTPVPGSHWDVEGIICPGSMPEPPASVDPPAAE